MGYLQILDYKPEARKEKHAHVQLTIYALALARRANLPLKNFKCAWFDEKDYFEFFHLKGVYQPRVRPQICNLPPFRGTGSAAGSIALGACKEKSGFAGLAGNLALFFLALDRTMYEPPEPVRKHGPEGPEERKNGGEDEMAVLNFGDRTQVFNHG